MPVNNHIDFLRLLLSQWNINLLPVHVFLIVSVLLNVACRRIEYGCWNLDYLSGLIFLYIDYITRDYSGI